jgi:uncharacterized protein YndB with AHSA1/START domain
MGGEAIWSTAQHVRRREPYMPYTFTLTTTIPASPEQIYEAWLDSIGHSEMTGGEATMSEEVGAAVTAWDGYISGRNLELIPGERIVQSWRTTEFADNDEDSIITVVLQEAGDGTLLTLEHSNVPDTHKSYEEGGWHANYFEPMVAYFAALNEDEGQPAAYQAPPARPAKRAAKPSAKNGGRKSGGKKTTAKKRASAATRPAKGAKPAKPAARPAKAARKKTTGRGAAKARSAAARKPAKRKPAKRKPAERKATRKSPRRTRR